MTWGMSRLGPRCVRLKSANANSLKQSPVVRRGGSTAGERLQFLPCWEWWNRKQVKLKRLSQGMRRGRRSRDGLNFSFIPFFHFLFFHLQCLGRNRCERFVTPTPLVFVWCYHKKVQKPCMWRPLCCIFSFPFYQLELFSGGLSTA